MLQRLKLQEGWMTFLLLAGTILIVSGAIQQADWADDLSILTPVTLLGLGLGLALAKWRRLPWLLAHPLAALIGGWFIIFRLEPLLPLASDQHSWMNAFNFLIERARAWYGVTGTEEYADDFYLFLLGISALIFLVAYSSTWMLFRSRWLWPALLLPAVVLLVNLGYAPANVSSALTFFVIGAILLITRFHVAEREEEWQRGGVAYPESLGWRALWIGLVVVMLTVGFGWGAPFAVSGKMLDTAWSRVNGPWLRMEGFVNERFGSLRGPGARGAGNFASFGDRFRLGGPLKLSQNPVLVLQADRPYYLKARTYDTFDGQQWNSNVDATFVSNNDGRNYVPQIDLAAGQDLSVPELAQTERRDVTVRMLRQGGGPLLIADQFVNTNQNSLVVLSWTQYRNEVIDLTTTDIERLPPDLRQIATLLRTAPGPLRNTDDQGNVLLIRATPTVAPSGTRRPGLPDPLTQVPRTPAPTATAFVPTPATWERPIEDERNALRGRLIGVRPVVRNGVAVRMIVDGQVPNYGDVEAVIPNAQTPRGGTYATSFLASTALGPQLREAGGDYPDWVVRRYLQLPGSTSDRTRQLAKELENGLVPYDAALSIQNWLRDNITYNESIPYPPADRDLVDYLLFDSRQGYCEYYSTAMVVMLRSLGIPAREVVGYFSGEYSEEQIGYLYRESNAHAWVEAYFPNYGWIAFEPTSPRPAFEREPAPPPVDDPNAGATIGGGATGTGADEPFPDDPPFLGDPGTLATTEQPSRFWEVTRISLPIIALLAIVVAFLWLSAFRGLSPSGQFYARMTRSGRLAGVRPPPGTTPYEWARAVGDRVPNARRSLDQITDLYVRERYAGTEPTIQELRLVQRAWLSFRGALLRSFLSLRRQRPTAEGGD